MLPTVWPLSSRFSHPPTGCPQAMQPVAKLLGYSCLFFTSHKSHVTDDCEGILKLTIVYVCVVCVCLCVCVCTRVHSVPLVWVGGMTFCIRLVREKLRIFPYGQYMSIYWLSGDIVRFKVKMGIEEKCTKMLTPFPMDFPHTPQHAVHGAMTSLALAGIYCARTLLGRCVYKRVDVYMITLSCTWRIYALCEHLLV